MIVSKNAETGWWTDIIIQGEVVATLTNTHDPSVCAERLCDIHDRRGEEPWASWPLNWREDRGIMEMIDPHSGIGHPTPAQIQYWRSVSPERSWHASAHGCDGRCAGSLDQLS